MIRLVTWFLLLIALHGTHQKSTPASTSYRAGVVEFHTSWYKDDPMRTLSTNTQRFVEFIEEAGEKDVDIIVFPEAALTGINFTTKSQFEPWTSLVPGPSENYVPCNGSKFLVSETLKNISCAAARHGVYVVINLAEKVQTSGEVIYHNTNVAFDRNGKIIARYRKSNLYFEPVFNVTESPEHSTFETDFGVTFGIIICADILYGDPAIHLTRILNIRDIIFSTAWFSTTPFLTPLQIQSGWSYAEDVNFLAAGYNRRQYSNAGSGIYLGRQGIGKAIIPSVDTSELVIFEVPKKMGQTKAHDHNAESHAHHHDHSTDTKSTSAQMSLPKPSSLSRDIPFSTYRESLAQWKTKLIAKNTSGSMTDKLCHNAVCCDFTIKIRKPDNFLAYRLTAFDGLLRFDNETTSGVRSCAVVQCANDNIDSCGDVKISQAIFDEIIVVATYDYNLNSSMMPSTLRQDLRPFEAFEFDEHKHEKHIHVTISTTGTTEGLVTFGLWGRNFDKDGTSAASSNWVYSLSFLPLILAGLVALY